MKHTVGIANIFLLLKQIILSFFTIFLLFRHVFGPGRHSWDDHQEDVLPILQIRSENAAKLLTSVNKYDQVENRTQVRDEPL